MMTKPTIILAEEEPVGSIIHSIREQMRDLVARANSHEISKFGPDDISDLDAIICKAQLIASVIEARDPPKFQVRYRR
jgi:hypothetical protein